MNPLKVLSQMGFSSHFISQLAPQELEHPPVGRVRFASRHQFLLATPQGDRQALLHPSLEGSEQRIVVGDWVRFYENDPLIILQKFDPFQTLSRRDPGGWVQIIASNLHWGLVCLPADQPANLRRLERWLAVGKESDLPLAVVITKSELGESEPIRAAIATICDLPVISVSALGDLGRSDLEAFFEPGKTCALLGLSGVGKSTLINWLLRENLQNTKEIREDGRGRHTTTARHLFQLPNGAWLLDNPGIRTLGLIEEASLNAVFPEIERLLGLCKFRDCSHDVEPGCALLSALKSGEISLDRWQAWDKLQRELAWERDREQAQREARRKHRKNHLDYRAKSKWLAKQQFDD